MKKLFVIPFTILVFIACQKDEEAIVPANEEIEDSINSGYLQLKVGNYWIYQNVLINSSGAETVMEDMDSVAITRDTIIQGVRYSVMEGINYPFTGKEWIVLDYLKDSSGYLVNEEGRIYFSDKNFTDTLHVKNEIIGDDLYYTIFYSMSRENSRISVPAGNYEVLNLKGAVYYSEEQTGIQNPRYTNNYYAEGIGKILSSYVYLASNSRLEKRLVRYHIRK